MTEREQVLDGEPRCGHVVDELPVSVRDRLPHPGDRHAEAAQDLRLGVVELEPDHEDRVDPPAHRQRGEELAAAVLVTEHVQHEVVVVPAQHLLDAADDLCEEPAARERQDDAHGAHPPGGEPGGQRRGGVPQLVRGSQDTSPGVPGDVRQAA